MQSFSQKTFSASGRALLFLACLLQCAVAQSQPVAAESVPQNPYLADSTYPISHANSAQSVSSNVAGFGDLGRPLKDTEISWRPTEIGDANIRYSSPYPNGKRVAWVGGNKSLFKFDADTMQLLSSLQIIKGERISAQQIVDHVNHIDQLTGKAFLDAAVTKLLSEPAQLIAAFYTLVSSENEQYIGINDVAEKKLILRVYGDAVKDDPASGIVLRRELVLPDVNTNKTLVFGVSMTYDGVLILTLTDGTVFAISRDLKILDRIALPHIKNTSASDGGKGEGLFSSFIRNGTALDDDGGIYIVTNDYMHRVQWTGKKLSLREADGAWAARYDSGKRGSGTTPNLMGWGKEDKLVLIGAGLGGSRLLAFWRDRIPTDWKGIKGYDRRLAAAVDIDFGKTSNPNAILEVTQTVKGYGTFMMASVPEKDYVADMGFKASEAGQFFGLAYGEGQERQYTNWGGMRFDWNPQKRKFDFRWHNGYPISFTTTVSIVDAADVLYTIGTRDGIFTLEGVDWNTGNSKFFYKLGKSQRFNPTGAALNIAPNGALDCACTGGMGVIRIMPESASQLASP